MQTQKLFIENADFDYIGQDFNWPCTYSALDLDQWSVLSAFITAPCAQHIKREYERGKNLVCVLCHYCVQQYTHTDSNFPLLKFSLEMCSTVCRKSRPLIQIQSTVCARPIEILAYVVKVCILNKKFLCLQVECCLKDPYRVYLKPFCCTIIPYTQHNIWCTKGAFFDHQGVVV